MTKFNKEKVVNMIKDFFIKNGYKVDIKDTTVSYTQFVATKYSSDALYVNFYVLLTNRYKIDTDKDISYVRLSGHIGDAGTAETMIYEARIECDNGNKLIKRLEKMLADDALMKTINCTIPLPPYVYKCF